MKAKTKIDMGLKTKMKKQPMKKKIKRIISMTKCGGILSILLLGVFGSLVNGAAGISKAINDNKTAQRQYFAPYKRGRGVTTEKIKKI